MSINISELIWTVICFFVLLVVLKKLLFDPLVSFMAARDARIQDGLNAGRTAQQQLDAAAQARSDAQRRQSAAADALLAEAKSASERKRAQTLQAAHQEAAQAMRALGIAYLPDFNRFSTREIHALPGMDDDAMARLNAVLRAHGVPPKAYPLL